MPDTEHPEPEPVKVRMLDEIRERYSRLSPVIAVLPTEPADREAS